MSKTTIKIPTEVHYELKLFATINKENMETVVATAIEKELKARGHKFSGKKKKVNGHVL